MILNLSALVRHMTNPLGTIRASDGLTSKVTLLETCHFSFKPCPLSLPLPPPNPLWTGCFFHRIPFAISLAHSDRNSRRRQSVTAQDLPRNAGIYKYYIALYTSNWECVQLCVCITVRLVVNPTASDVDAKAWCPGEIVFMSLVIHSLALYSHFHFLLLFVFFIAQRFSKAKD